MEKYIYDESNGLWYELEGDYYFPCAKQEERIPIGIWGRRHFEYIKKHKEPFYTSLILKGEINKYLAEIDSQAEEMFNRLVQQMAEREGVTEQLKETDQMRWVGLMNNIKSAAQEVVMNDIILC